MQPATLPCSPHQSQQRLIPPGPQESPIHCNALSARDLEVFWQDLLSVYRDMLVIKTTENAARYLDLADAEAEELTSITEGFSKSTLLSHCRLVENALFAMQKSNAAKRMIAELTLVQLCDPRLDTSPESLVARIERLEDAAVTGALTRAEAPREPAPQKAAVKEPKKAPPVASDPPVAPKPAAAAAPKAGGRVLTRLRGFINCIERIRRDNSMLASFIGEARAYLDEQKRVVVILPSAFAEMMLEQNGGRDVLRRALSVELSREVRDGELIVEVQGAPSAKNDTVIDDILSAAEGGQ